MVSWVMLLKAPVADWTSCLYRLADSAASARRSRKIKIRGIRQRLNLGDKATFLKKLLEKRTCFALDAHE